MKIGSIKIVTFESNKEGKKLKQQYGKRLVVEILRDGINTQGRKEIIAKVLFTHSSPFKFLIGKEIVLPNNKGILWQLKNGSLNVEEEESRSIPVHYEQQNEHYMLELY